MFQKLLKAEETIKEREDLITKIQKGESFKTRLRGLVTGVMEKQITHSPAKSLPVPVCQQLSVF